VPLLASNERHRITELRAQSPRTSLPMKTSATPDQRPQSRHTAPHPNPFISDRLPGALKPTGGFGLRRLAEQHNCALPVCAAYRQSVPQ
jgi:hypothetical protein